MCRFISGKKPCELQRSVTYPAVEQQSASVAQNLPQQPARQAPKVSRPYALEAITLSELAEDRVDAAAETAEVNASLDLVLLSQRRAQVAFSVAQPFKETFIRVN
jgi:hypothetical protein